jgi:hypothetical protein
MVNLIEIVFEQYFKPDEGVMYVDIRRKNIPGRGRMHGILLE